MPAATAEPVPLLCRRPTCRGDTGLTCTPAVLTLSDGAEVRSRVVITCRRCKGKFSWRPADKPPRRVRQQPAPRPES